MCLIYGIGDFEANDMPPTHRGLSAGFRGGVFSFKNKIGISVNYSSEGPISGVQGKRTCRVMSPHADLSYRHSISDIDMDIMRLINLNK